MFVLLPPSETKAIGGTGPALELTTLRFPELSGARELLIGALTTLCADVPAARRALSVAASKDVEISGSAALRRTPTMPALLRYTGVLYEALDVRGLPPSARARANERLLITSALFGLLGGDDAVPAYRLSAGSALPGLPGLQAFWRAALAAPIATLDRPLVDLRSGAYAAFAPIPDAITVRVVTENSFGQRNVVSHFKQGDKGNAGQGVGDLAGRNLRHQCGGEGGTEGRPPRRKDRGTFAGDHHLKRTRNSGPHDQRGGSERSCTSANSPA